MSSLIDSSTGWWDVALSQHDKLIWGGGGGSKQGSYTVKSAYHMELSRCT